jgi:hypothetical protein
MIAVSAHGMREVQTLAFAVRRSADWRAGRDVMLRNILPQIDPTLKGARRRSRASARSEVESRTRTTARPLVSAAMRSHPSRSPLEEGRRATPARPRAPNPSQWNDRRPHSWPPRLAAASSPRRRARSQSASTPPTTSV